MTRYVVRRLLVLVPVLAVVAVVTFSLSYLTPGDPTRAILGDDATDEQRAMLRAELGLDESLPVQFGRWLAGVARLDFGDSLFYDQSVTATLGEYAEPTLFLAVYATLLALVLGVPAGVVAALRRNSWLDRVLMVVSVGATAVPSFFLGMLLIVVAAVQLGWFPSGGYVSPADSLSGHVRSMVLPSLTLGFTLISFARVVRSSMLDVLSSEFVEAAHAKGLRRSVVVLRHALRNAAIPAVTVLGIHFANLVGGAVVTEFVFNLRGIGQLLVQSVARRDLPVIQGTVMLAACLYALVTLLIDIVYVYLDPRVRYE